MYCKISAARNQLRKKNQGDFPIDLKTVFGHDHHQSWWTSLKNAWTFTLGFAEVAFCAPFPPRCSFNFSIPNSHSPSALSPKFIEVRKWSTLEKSNTVQFSQKNVQDHLIAISCHQVTTYGRSGFPQTRRDTLAIFTTDHKPLHWRAAATKIPKSCRLGSKGGRHTAESRDTERGTNWMYQPHFFTVGADSEIRRSVRQIQP
jgi:hypothetical protein